MNGIPVVIGILENRNKEIEDVENNFMLTFKVKKSIKKSPNNKLTSFLGRNIQIKIT